MAGRRSRRRAKVAVKPVEDSPPKMTPSPSPSPPPSSSSSPSSSGGSTDGTAAAAHRKTASSRLQPLPEDGDEFWTQSDMRTMRQQLLDTIHRSYLDAISRLPPAELRRTAGLARSLLIGGHCLGPLQPVHNIVVNSIWYAAAFPLRRPVTTGAESDDEDEVRAILSTDGLTRICHRSLDGLLAALHHLCPSLSTTEALWKLFSAGADLNAAIVLANGTTTSSALHVIASRGLDAFHVAAEAARHPNPTTFAQFLSSALPAANVQHNVVQLLLTRRVLATRHINHLSNVLVPSPPHEPSKAPLVLSPQVVDRIASQRKQIKETGKQVINVVNTALQEYMSRSGEHLTLHSVCGASLLKEEELNNCYHINFLAYHMDSGSAVGTPVLFFTEAIILSSGETDIRLCVPVRLFTDIGCCFACKINRKKIVHPIYDEYFCGRKFQEDEVDYGYDFPSHLDVDYIFFDADRDRAFANYLWKESRDH
ncbi:unnamed protein product [Urochloa humidicola]